MKHVIILQIVLLASAAGAATDPNLVAWLTFDEGTGTIAYDSAGDNDGQLINEPTWIAGKIGGGLSFDEVDDYIYIPSHPSLNVTNAFTFAFWMYIDADEIPQGTILSKDGTSDTTGAYNVYVFSNWTVGYETNNKYPEIRSTVDSLLPGIWQHIAITFNSSVSPSIKIYIDGMENATGSPPAPSILSTPLMIGRRGKSTEPWYHNGNLDDIRIYNRALSAEEVQELYEESLPELTGLEIIGPDEVAEEFTACYKAIAHYDNGTPKDITASAEWSVAPNAVATIEAGQLTTGQALYPEQDVTLYAQYTENETTVDAEKQVSILAICPTGTALNFDGSNDYVRIPDGPMNQITTNHMSVIAWIKLNNNVGPTQRRIICKQQTPPMAWGLEIAGNGYGGATGNQLNFHDSSGTTFYNCLSSTHLLPNRWYYVAVTDNAGEINIYINGVLDKSCSGGYGIPSMINAPVMIGRTNPESAFYFDGIIDEVALFDRAISEDEIKAMMFNRTAGSIPNLIAYWAFDDANGQTATDASGHSNNGTLGNSQEPDIADPCWVESDAPINQCTTEQVLVRNLVGATENKEIANQNIADARAKERASLELIEELRRQTRKDKHYDSFARARAQIIVALAQEKIASRLIDATIQRLEEALRLLGYETDSNSRP